MKSTFQRAREENEMLRTILTHKKPHWRDLILTAEEVCSLMAKGAIKTMPDAIYDDLGREWERRRHVEAAANARKKAALS